MKTCSWKGRFGRWPGVSMIIIEAGGQQVWPVFKHGWSCPDPEGGHYRTECARPFGIQQGPGHGTTQAG